MLDLTEKLLQSHPIYNGRIIRVRRDEVLLPDGGHGLREVVDHPGGVGILALDDKGQVALVRQYRYAVGEHLWEIPAGKREKGEEPRITARRELHEEVGADAERWTDLGTLIASPGCYAERPAPGRQNRGRRAQGQGAEGKEWPIKPGCFFNRNRL